MRFRWASNKFTIQRTQTTPHGSQFHYIPDVLRELAGRNEDLGHADVVVRHHDDLEQVADVQVVVDGGGSISDEADDALGLPVGGERLAPEHHHARHFCPGRQLRIHNMAQTAVL